MNLKPLRVPADYFVNNPGQKTKDAQILYDFEKVELTTTQGALVYIKNASYPHKTIPISEAVGQINILKEYTKQNIYNLVFLFGITKFINNFNVFFEKCFFNYRVEVKYMCPFAKSVFYIINDIANYLNLKNKPTIAQFAYNIAHVFEFDDAYRYRAQDVFSMLNALNFNKNIRKELRRVFDIALGREVHEPQRNKMAKLYKLIIYSTYIPGLSKALKAVIPVYLYALRFDAGDIYWAGFKDNYHFMGVTHEEHKKKNKIPMMYTVS